MTNHLNRTHDGFIQYSNDIHESGVMTPAAVVSTTALSSTHFDVIFIGAGFSGLIAARELSLRHRTVLLIEARDRIGGRTFTTKLGDQQYEMGGGWIHWSQPHVWSEITRYGLSICETNGATADRISLLLENGSRLKVLSMTNLFPEICRAMDDYSNVDGVQGRTVLPIPHNPFAAREVVELYDKLSMQDRLDHISASFNNNQDLYDVMDAYLSMNSQGKLSEGGFLDHLRWWALGDFDTARLFDKTSRYKILEGTSALARAILNDCHDIKLLLSTPVRSIQRTDDNQVTIFTDNGQSFTARSALITVPLNALYKMNFSPPLKLGKQRAINERQCRGGTKFAIKLEKPIGNWCGFAPYPNPITQAFTDDEEGTIIIAFGVDDLLNIRDFNAVQYELRKWLPDIQIKYIIGHDWRKDSFAEGTWGWFRPGQITSNLSILQEYEPPLFFASSDTANGWRSFMDGALESGLSVVQHIERYLKND
ncbi:unnamed protein product [Adineta ricciae]|uniref:Amine oxidase n=1 Tax=Adineta ricciae TaxID=249248 RepID=A0A813NJ18_ADIRI|nr:unnamed protein product [Adineta ricciae]CAF1100323.1 unnamed protein product [Adineta ricciae]